MSDLEQYRQEIDELDEQLVRLFLRRMEVTGKVGEYKLAHGMQVLDRERERGGCQPDQASGGGHPAGGGRKGAIPDHHGHQPPPAAGADRPDGKRHELRANLAREILRLRELQEQTVMGRCRQSCAPGAYSGTATFYQFSAAYHHRI